MPSARRSTPRRAHDVSRGSRSPSTWTRNEQIRRDAPLRVRSRRAVINSAPMSDALEEETTEVEEPTHEELSAEEREQRAAALSQVRTYGDPVLRSRASDVTDFGPELAEDAERMVAIMRDAMGVGLAATQLGTLRRLLVFQAAADA